MYNVNFPTSHLTAIKSRISPELVLNALFALAARAACFLYHRSTVIKPFRLSSCSVRIDRFCWLGIFGVLLGKNSF